MNWARRGVSTSLLACSLLTAFLFGPTLETAAQTAGTFIPTGNMTEPRTRHTATLLMNAKVLITGGDNFEGRSLATAELYDPVTGSFTATGNMTTGRSGHSATLLPDGRVLIAGGSTDVDRLASYLDTAEIYDPSTGTFTATGNMVNPQAS